MLVAMKRHHALVPIATAIFGVLVACSDSESTPASPSSSSSSGGSTSSSGGSSSSSSSSGDIPDAGDSGIPEWVGDGGTVSSKMNFFVTSRNPGNGGDLRANASDTDGLAGADAFCKQLAEAVSPILGAKTWRAYLSTSTVSARSRIGNGPFYNAKGDLVANDVAQLHDEGQQNLLSLDNSLDENGNQVPSSGGNNVHDILTGSQADGSAAANTCNNWTVSDNTATARVGHSNRAGRGAAPTSWNSAHDSQGCSLQAFANTGGRGSFYCFALP